MHDDALRLWTSIVDFGRNCLPMRRLETSAVDTEPSLFLEPPRWGKNGATNGQ